MVPDSVMPIPRMLFALVVAVLMLPGCGNDDSPTAPSEQPAFSRTDLLIGTGASAVSGSILSVNYTGWLYDSTKPDSKGLQFETSFGRTPFDFALGSGQVIQGWDEGVPGMQVGGVRRLVIPASMAYGGFRSGPVPANAALVFEIELLNVQ